MAANKTWIGGTDGDYGDALNWLPISIRSSAYSWTVSGSGTGEYYLRTAASGDPGIPEPPYVLQAGVAMTGGTVGSLTAGQWDYGDNDALGYSTIYVRLTGSGDPDAQLSGHVTYQDIPRTDDDVRIPAASIQAIDEGLDQASVAIGDFIVEEGYNEAIGTNVSGVITNLRIDPNRFEFFGNGASYIDITTAAIPVQVFGTASAVAGARGLYLIGTAISTLSVVSGSVGIAVNHGELSSVTTARIVGPSASVWFGEGCTLTTLENTDGESKVRCAATTITIQGGTVYTEEVGAVTTVTQNAGLFYGNSTGTITTLTGNGGLASFLKNGSSRTITTYAQNPGHDIEYNPNILTITNESAPNGPIRKSSSRATAA